AAEQQQARVPAHCFGKLHLMRLLGLVHSPVPPGQTVRTTPPAPCGIPRTVDPDQPAEASARPGFLAGPRAAPGCLPPAAPHSESSANGAPASRYTPPAGGPGSAPDRSGGTAGALLRGPATSPHPGARKPGVGP